MNKQEIVRLIPEAYNALKTLKIAKENKATGFFEIENVFKGYISNFGAAITMGSFKAAVAFFTHTDSSSLNSDKSQLGEAVYYLITGGKQTQEKNLLTWVCEENDISEAEKKEKVLNCVIALKLAMKRFKILKSEEEG